VDVAFPLGCFIAVTACKGRVSRPLVKRHMYAALAKELTDRVVPGRHVRGRDAALDKVVQVDQGPIRAGTPAVETRRPTPGVDPSGRVRADHEARSRLQRAGYLNVKGAVRGLRGDGTIKIRDAVPARWTCNARVPRRRTPPTPWPVHYKARPSRTCSDMPIEEAAGSSRPFPRSNGTWHLVDVGLGYVRRGPPPDPVRREASGSRLESELQRRSTGRTILRPRRAPTTGCT